MASSSKKRTTMAKLMREQNVRERQREKQAKKAARRLAAATEATRPDGEPLAAGE